MDQTEREQRIVRYADGLVAQFHLERWQRDYLVEALRNRRHIADMTFRAHKPAAVTILGHLLSPEQITEFLSLVNCR
jgi:hypothetical protein